MSKNLQFLDDPDDVPFVNENITLYIGVDGSDTLNSGSVDSPFRTVGKAVDVLRNKQIGKDNIVTIQLGESQTNRTGVGSKKYFEEEEIVVDFDTAKRLKIKGTKPTDHEVVAISYFDAASDRDGYYCQVLVTNQDKVNIGDYIAIYDHLVMKKKDPSYYWVRNNIGFAFSRSITPSSCYVESIRGNMILGVHEVVDVSETIEHSGNYSTTPTEIFYPEDLKVGLVTLHIKTNNFTHQRLKEVPYWNTLGTKFNEPLFSYAAGEGNSPEQARGNNSIPPIFYGAEMLSNPATLESNGYEQFYYASGVQQIEIVDIMVRGYKLSLTALDSKIADPRTGVFAKNISLLWNDKTLTGYNRVTVANQLASYFYKKLINDLKITRDLPFYFGESTDPFVTVKQIVKAAKKVRDYLLTGARALSGIPPWDEDNHPGYGFGPFESNVVRTSPSLGGGAEIDKSSYPSVYQDENRFSILLRYYNLYPPVNGQLYQPTLVKRIRSWYNDNGAANGMQLDRWDAKGNSSPFFCGYVTPQGWYKQRYNASPEGNGGSPIPSLTDSNDADGYNRLFDGVQPHYVGNDNTNFRSIADGASGSFSNERDSTKNLTWVDPSTFGSENGFAVGTGGTGAGGNIGRGSMGSVWYSGSVNSYAKGTIANGGKPPDAPPGPPGPPSAMGQYIFDNYSFGYLTNEDTMTPTLDSITEMDDPDNILNSTSIIERVDFLHGAQSMNLRAKCYKSIMRFNGNGLTIRQKTKLALLKDVCIVGINKSPQQRYYGIIADGESVLNASNIAVCGFGCGISAKNQSLVNLLADLGNSTNTRNGDIFSPIDTAAIVSANDIGIESTLKSHVNAQRTVSSGSKLANYLAIANSSIDCSNTMSVSGFSHGYVCEFNSYMKAVNAFSEFNAGVGFCCVNNSILVCHRSRSIWNGSHGVFAKNKGSIKCFEFICRSNDGDGFLAQDHSVISAGANSNNWANWRTHFMSASDGQGANLISDYYGIYATLPPHLFQVNVSSNGFIPLPYAARSINNNPTHGLHLFYHESNSTIAEFNAGSGFAAETDSTIIADNTIARYNSKKYGEFFIYGWSGTRGSFPTDTFTPSEVF